MRSIVIIAHNLRSTHNIGSLLRTAEGIGVDKVYLTGYTPYPVVEQDQRLPHLALKLEAAIKKTALGAEKTQAWERIEDIDIVISNLKVAGYEIYALEQTPDAILLPDFNAPNKCAVILGSEVTGVPEDILKKCDGHIVIPMFGKKESFNVVQAAAMLLYKLRF